MAAEEDLFAHCIAASTTDKKQGWICWPNDFVHFIPDTGKRLILMNNLRDLFGRKVN